MWFDTTILRRGAALAARVAGAALIAALAATAPTAHAQELEADVALAFVEGVADEMFDVLRDEEREEDLAEAFRALIVDNAAVSDIARVVMGRPWRAMSDPQREAYTEALIDVVAFTYAGYLNDFSDQTLEFLDADDQGRRGVFVRSVIRDGVDEIELLWRVSDRNGPPQLIDVYIAGVSLIVTQQTDVAALLEQTGGDFDALIDALQVRAADARAESGV